MNVIARDYYSILGVPEDADYDRIRSAYRKLAIMYHPDTRSPDADPELNFTDISEAYETLSDASKRAAYDRHRKGIQEPWVKIPRGSPFRNYPRRGNDSFFTISLTLEDVCRDNVKRFVHIDRKENCPDCRGTGCKDAKVVEIECPVCGGAGALYTKPDPPDGFSGFVSYIRFSMTCHECKGSGNVIPEHAKCARCHGKGFRKFKRRLAINVPRGIAEGAVITCRHAGDVGENGGPPGDVRIRILLRPHDKFERLGDDLKVVLPLSVWDMVLGCERQVKTIYDNTVTVRIPPGSQPGEEIRLPHYGCPSVQDGMKGQLIVSLRGEIPRKLTEKQRDLIEKLKDMEQDHDTT